MKETKTVSGSPETRAAMHEVMAAFEAFKGANDARLAELEKKASADTLLEEKVARIDAAVGSAQARLDRALSETRRPQLGDWVAPSGGFAATSPMKGEETKSAFAAYMTGGSTLGLELKAGLSSGPSSGGYVVPPETERAIERRLMAGSPMREIATVRTVGSGVFRKPVSTAGVEAGWVAETAARPETDPATLALLEFPSADLYACPAATQSLLDDALIDLDEWLAAEVEDAFSAQETEAFVNGDGTNKPRGFLDYDLVEDGDQEWGEIGYVASGAAGAFPVSNPTDRLIDLIYAPKALYRPNARFVMNRRTVGTVRKFKDGDEAERRTLMLGPLQALTLEPGDRVQVPGKADLWRVERLSLDEEARAVLVPVPVVAMEDGTPVWRLPDRSGPAGAPWMRILELPSLVGRSEGVVVAAVAVEPWARHAVTAGPDALSQTLRGVARGPASVGVLTEPLRPGLCGRWDETATVMVQIEGRAPESRERLAVLAGANAVAVETGAAWEVIQYRTADLIGGDIWRLTGLLRGQGGGEPEADAGAATGAAVVFLDESLVELGAMREEYGLPLLWRAGAGGAVSSGPFVSELTHVLTGRAERPWRPVHLTIRAAGGGLALGWVARTRTGGDSWDGEPEPVDPLRFRVRILDGDAERRAVEVAGTAWQYSDADRVADFPGGCEAGCFEVSQVSIHGIWGPEAVAPLCEGGGMP